jgi:hypothetical protein
MTLFKASDVIAIGQPINPNFGAANGASAAGAPTIQLPVGMPLLVAASLGLVPANCLVSTVNGVNVGGPVGANGGDPCSVMELLSSGNGNQANGGIGPNSNAVPQNGEIQQVTVGLTQVAMQENGPTPVNADSIGLAPVSGGLPANTVVLVAAGFVG